MVKLHAFLALLLTGMALGLAAGMPPDKVLKSIQAGFGDALGFIAVVVGLGAMIGRFLEHSGGGRALADWLLDKFGKERAAWAMLVAAFLVGLPIFFEVGFVILVPLVWNLARETKRSLLFYGLPMAAALTMTHSLVPPHPAPAAASQLLGGDLGRTILYGIAMSLPMAIVGRHVLRHLDRAAHVHPRPRYRRRHERRATETESAAAHPGGGSAAAAARAADLRRHPRQLDQRAVQAGRGLSRPPLHGARHHRAGGHLLLRHSPRASRATQAARMAAESLAPMGSAAVHHGRRRRVQADHCRFRRGRVCRQVADHSRISPLLVVWLIAAAMRMAQGSATVAIITAAGIVAPIVKGIPGYSPES